MADDAVLVLDGARTATPVRVDEFEPSPDGEWIALLNTIEGRTCIRATVDVAESQRPQYGASGECFETVGDNISWSPDSSAIVSSGTNRSVRKGPVDVLGIDGSRTRVVDAFEERGPTFFDPDAEPEVIPDVVYATWLDAETVLYVELITREDFSTDPVAFSVPAVGGEPTVFFDPSTEGLDNAFWGVDATGNAATRWIADEDEGATTAIVDGNGTTMVATPDSRSSLLLRSTAAGSAVLSDGALVEGRRTGLDTGWFLVARDAADVVDLSPTDPRTTRIVDAVLSPNGTTLAVIGQPATASDNSDASLVLVPVADVLAAGGTVDLTEGIDIESDVGFATGISRPGGPLRWADNRHLLVIAEELLLEYGVVPLEKVPVEE